MLLLWHSISNILCPMANNLWHSWCNLGVECYGENQVMLMWELVQPYIVISKSIIVKRLKWVSMIQNCYQGACPLIGRCMPYVLCSSKVNRFYCSVVVWSGYCHSRYINQSIHRGTTAGLILSLTTDNMYIIVFPGFWMYYPMICMQELLVTVSAASVDSPSV